MAASKIYTVFDIAKILGVSPQYVRRLCKQDRLHAAKLGRDWTIYSPVIRGSK